MSDGFDNALREASANYQPNQTARSSLESVNLITVLAPPGSKACEIMVASGVPIVRGHTNARVNTIDEPCSQRIWLTAEKERTLLNLRRGNFVIAATHPCTGIFCGALVDDFPKTEDRVLMSVFPEQNQKLREGGTFGELVRVGIVPYDYDKWHKEQLRDTQADDLGYPASLIEAQVTLGEIVPDNGLLLISDDDIEAGGKILRQFAETSHQQRDSEVESRARAVASMALSRLTDEQRAAVR